MVAAGQDAGAGLRRRFWLQGEPESMPVFAGGACAGVFDGQRVGFSCEGGEGGRQAGSYLLDAFPDDGVAIAIATPEHLRAFEAWLAGVGVDVPAARARGS